MAFSPMLAEPTPTLPSGPGWRFEPKYDGMRCVAVATSAGVQLLTRSGNNDARQFPEVVEAVATLRARVGHDLVLDGEVVARVSDGFEGFAALQHRLGVQDEFRIRLLTKRCPAALVVFDLLVLGGTPLLSETLAFRRRRLEELLGGATSPGLRIAEHSEDGQEMLERALAEGWEGVIAKQAVSAYVPGGRGPAWLKYKSTLRQEFVIGGFTESDRRDYLRALVVGYFRDGQLVHAGEVGSGFSRRSLAAVHQVLHPITISTCPFAEPPQTRAPATWVEPCVVAEVRFQDWTEEGKLRFPRFVGLRSDKPALQVVREC
jgi:bifunctional non-homologous end joining protein LigD